jgi:hypothetical protein
MPTKTIDALPDLALFVHDAIATPGQAVQSADIASATVPPESSKSTVLRPSVNSRSAAGM